jgi:hypothetical protein
VEGAAAWLSVYRVTDDVLGTVEEAEVTAAGNANEGNYFRYGSGSRTYVYNWSTKGLATGTYLVTVHLDDGSTRDIRLALR